jgi:hypothetical protein
MISNRVNTLALIGCAVMLISGCATKGQTGALAGSGIGALAGQAIGGNTAGTLIGAGVGAGVGYLVGNEMDKKEARKLQSEKGGKRADTEPLGGTKWQVTNLNPRDFTGEYTSKLVEFGSGGYVVTTTTRPDGKVEISEETYRVVGDTLIVNKPGYLINARYSISGDEMVVNAQDFSAVLKRLR